MEYLVLLINDYIKYYKLFDFNLYSFKNIFTKS